MRSPAAARFIRTVAIILMLLLPMVSQPSGAGTSLIQDKSDFQNGIMNGTLIQNQSVSLELEVDAPYQWTRLNYGEPYPMWFPAFEYDSRHNEFVVVGSMAESDTTVEADTWTYNSSMDEWVPKYALDAPIWYQSYASGFGEIYRPFLMDYDTRIGEMILFGGRSGNETWTYNLTTNI